MKISCNEVLHIHSLHTTPVILAMDESRPLPPIPLTTETPFSVLYNPNNDRKAAMLGFEFSDVTSLLTIKHPPKVVRVTKNWTGDSTTISKGEILVINKHIVPGPHVTAGIVTFSISKMVEKFLPEECAGNFSTDPNMIQMSLLNIFSYISDPFPLVVYTPKPFKHANSDFIHLVGCDVIEYFAYSIKGEEIESQLPVHLSDVNLCRIADVQDCTSPKLTGSRVIKQVKATHFNDALNTYKNNGSKTQRSRPQPPLPSPKPIHRILSLPVPTDSSAMTPPLTVVQPPLLTQKPPPPPTRKPIVHYANVGNIGAATTRGIMGRPAPPKLSGAREEMMVQDMQYQNLTLPEASASVLHSFPDVKEGVLPNVVNDAGEPCIDPGTVYGQPCSQYHQKAMITRDDTTLPSSSPARQTHDLKSKSQTLHRKQARLPNHTSSFRLPPSSRNLAGHHDENATAAKLIASNMHRFIVPTAHASPQTPAPDKAETSIFSTNIENVMKMQKMAHDCLPYPKIEVPPPLPPPFIPNEIIMAPNFQGRSSRYQQDGVVNAGAQQPSMIEGYRQASEPLTLTQFVSQYSHQLPVSIHVSAAAGLISGPKCLDVTALKNKEVVIAEDYTGKQLEVLLMSSKRFALLYGQTNNEDMKGTLQGHTLKGVSEFLKLKYAPKVFCVTKSWKDSVISIDENEILIMQSAQREGVKKGIVVFSVLTRTLKFLPCVCTAHFSTNAVLLGLPMVDLIGCVPNLFPCSVCTVVYGKEPKCYPVDVITLKEVATTSVLECVPMWKGLNSTQEATVLSVPVGLSCVEVVVLEKLRNKNPGLTGTDHFDTKNSVSQAINKFVFLFIIIISLSWSSAQMKMDAMIQCVQPTMNFTK